jgi:hypothetical protein
MQLQPEEAWLRQRIIRLRSTLRFVKVAEVETLLREIISDMEARLELLEEDMRRRPVGEVASKDAQLKDSADYLPMMKLFTKPMTSAGRDFFLWPSGAPTPTALMKVASDYWRLQLPSCWRLLIRVPTRYSDDSSGRRGSACSSSRARQ